MTSAKRHHGVVVPVVTPVTEAGALDEAAARGIVERLVAAGVHGIFVLGTTGERASASAALERRLVEVAVAGSAGRALVYAGIGDNCLARAVEVAAESFALGADAVVAHAPSYYPLGPDDLFAYFRMLADQVRGDLLLYNIPQTTHHSIPVEVVARLADHPRIVGFKDSENTAGRPEALAAALGGSDRFALMMGVSAHSARALRLGMDGLVPSSGNLAPRLWRTLWDEAGSGRWEAVDGLQSRLDEVAALFQKGRSLGQALAALKGAMSLLGLCQPAMLPPLRGLAGAELDALGDGLRALAARVPELDRAGGTARA